MKTKLAKLKEKQAEIELMLALLELKEVKQYHHEEQHKKQVLREWRESGIIR